MASVKKHRSGGRVRGDDEGRGVEDMEISRARDEARAAITDYNLAETSDARMRVQLRNLEANERDERVSRAVDASDTPETKDDYRRRSDIADLRSRIANNPDVKKPAPMKSGGTVKMAAGGKVRGCGAALRGKTRGKIC